MSSVDQLSRLFGRLAAGDQLGAVGVAREIAETEESRGHRSAARTLRGSLVAATPESSPAVPAGLFIQELPGPALEKVALAPKARSHLAEVAEEWRARDALAAAGIPRRSRLLFWGPPGCGKTLSARALGTELGLPVVTVRLSSLVGAYLGQTGTHLRELFAHAQVTPCVLLLDEFDAVGRSRGRVSDVGELDRVVISLLQEFDHSRPAGLVIAATNLQESLDQALWRRFDLSLEFAAPAKRELERFARRRLRDLGLGRNPAFVESVKGLGAYSEVDSALNDLRRREVLSRVRTTQ